MNRTQIVQTVVNCTQFGQTVNDFIQCVQSVQVLHTCKIFHFISVQIVLIPMFTRLKIREPTILLGVLGSLLIRNVVKGFAAYSWMYYLGKSHKVYNHAMWGILR